MRQMKFIKAERGYTCKITKAMDCYIKVEEALPESLGFKTYIEKPIDDTNIAAIYFPPSMIGTIIIVKDIIKNFIITDANKMYQDKLEKFLNLKYVGTKIKWD